MFSFNFLSFLFNKDRHYIRHNLRGCFAVSYSHYTGPAHRIAFREFIFICFMFVQ